MPPVLIPASCGSQSAPCVTLSYFGGVYYVGVSGEVRATARTSPGVVSFAHLVSASGLTANDDGALIAAMARADERAAAQLYDKYSAVLFALAVRIVGEPADAEEVVLDTFTQAWNTASRYEVGRGTVLGWLTTIVRTRALDCVRGRGRRSKAVDNASRSLGDEPLAVAGPSPSASDMVEQDERAGAVSSAMNVLSGQQRVAIEMAFFEGLTHSEIAERLDEPLGTIKTRIRLGMQKLRDVLHDLPRALVS